ncbi:spore coat protein [Thalassorhabdus alkalitolerans]|uniref:Spore coat protein n=1 Tax=Thalassorhabdus alkalitolerans TaxID=2282697 RepID=A0ABW0YK31_9BACI
MFGRHHRPRPKVLPTVMHPTKCHVKHHCCEYIVPEVHPSHTTNVTHHNYKHLHSFPHTESAVDQITHQHFVAGPGAPGPQVAGAHMPGPGMMGPQVAGAHMPGPGMMGPQVAGAHMPGKKGPMGPQVAGAHMPGPKCHNRPKFF